MILILFYYSMILWNPNPMFISKKKWDSYTDEQKFEIRKKHTENLAILKKQKEEMYATQYNMAFDMPKKDVNYIHYKKKHRF